MKVKINLAKSSGFCFGVKRAIEVALNTAKEYKGYKIEMIGDIVHNEDVCRGIAEAGINKIKKLCKSKKKVFVISAHGIALDVINKAKKMGYVIVDATCPRVKDIHNTAIEMEKQGRTIIIIGDKEHSEVRGIVGHLKKKPIIINDENNIPVKKINKLAKVGVVVQSTQNVKKIDRMFKILGKCMSDVKLCNTICIPTKRKQSEIRKLPLENDVIIVIGSKMSANTGRLYEISKNINHRTYWVQSDKGLKPVWFNGAVKIGIIAGASTPDAVTQKVINMIERAANG
ncbi:MAG: 4-hydroxy-3-methylbut-2-enyl diphosphate reductase [Candidatus Omnitrophica bacterium]|nr:4-hydroxy-3-methylbut-2-enyl diphosphate reductase [Candidatus Omnitrophota bacterium]MDD5081098.1 4-hydroxy-3-methylbut-2-enyl diphosphate reductase [Candidatus Omnitrophota bacterium]